MTAKQSSTNAQLNVGPVFSRPFDTNGDTATVLRNVANHSPCYRSFFQQLEASPLAQQRDCTVVDLAEVGGLARETVVRVVQQVFEPLQLAALKLGRRGGETRVIFQQPLLDLCGLALQQTHN